MTYTTITLLAFGFGMVAVLNASAPPPRDDQPSVCNVLSDPQEYVGKQIAVEGILTIGEHQTLLAAYPSCPRGVVRVESESASWRLEYEKAGGRKGVGVLATVKGQIVISKKTHGPAFAVSSVRNIRSLPPAVPK